MKNRIGLISLFLVSLCLTSAAGEQTWKAYVKLLNKMYVGLTPYKMPNSVDGPGTIFLVDDKGVEQLYFNQETAFPELDLQQPVEIPAASFSKISNMQFKVGLSVADQKILTNEVNLVASLAITKDTTATVSVAKPMVYRVQDGLLNAKINELDVRKPLHEDILKKLQRPNVIVISGALHVDSFVYTFHRKSAIDSNLDANLGSKSKGLNVTYQKITDTTFTLEARSPMFWAYYAYPINRTEMEQLYNDKLRLKELEDKEERRANFDNEIMKFKDEQGKITAMTIEMAVKTKESNDLEKELQEKKDQQIKTTDAATAALIKAEIENLEARMDLTKRHISGLQDQMEALKKDARAFIADKSAMTSLASDPSRDLREMELLKKKKYSLFGDKVIIPSEIKAYK